MRRVATMLFIPAFAFGALVSCGGGGTYSEENTEESTDAVDEMLAEEAPVYSGETAVGVVHSVSDFDAWMKAYEEVSEPTARIAVFANVDDPNEIAVFELTTNHEDTKARFASSDMKETMQKAGVTGEPVFTYYDMKFMNPEDSERMYRVAMEHEVSDYTAWRAKFDADEARRTEAGMELRGLATDASNPNMVYMMFATDDLEAIKGMMADPEMKAVMEEAGVISEPIATFWKLTS